MAPASDNPTITSALADEPSIEERRALIERIAASEQFSRSARLRDFLLYVGKQSLKNGCPEINEHEIGAKVFGRPESYDRSQDNIVRVNATELRKRIELYFASTGAHESLILEIPRGGYKPIFHRRLPETKDQSVPSVVEIASTASAFSSPEIATREHSLRHFSHILWGALSLILAIGCVVLFQQNRSMRSALHPWEDKPAVAAFWTGFLNAHQETDIVLPDTSVGISEELTRNPISLSEYLNHNYIAQVQSLNISPDRRADLVDIFGHNLVTFGDVRAAQQILALDPLSTLLHLDVARFYLADSIKHNNVILIGGKKANPWVYLFDDLMNFRLDRESDSVPMSVVNSHPQAGEQASYVGALNQNALIGYSVIAFLPNPSRTGNAIVLAGTDSDATSAAAEFLTSENQLEKFRDTLHTDHFPYFEVLLKTSRLSGTSFNAQIVAYRTYPGLH